jgi:uncharacterized phage infection (PIP) family protein YhgE
MIAALLMALFQDDVQPWIEKLGSSEYAVREEAQKKIEAMGKAVVPQLKAALEKTQDMEVKTRIEDILKKLDKPAETKQIEEDRPDPNKQLEKVSKIVEELQKVLADKDKSADDKLRKVEGLAEDLRDAARRRGADQAGNLNRVVRRRIQFNGQGFDQIPEDMRKQIEEQQKRTQEMIERILKDHGWDKKD